MSIIGLVAVALAVVGGLCLITALGQLWSVGGQAEDMVGPWSAKRPAPPPLPLIPRNLNSLIWGETLGWQRPEQWDALTYRLDELEIELGGSPPLQPPPADYSPNWLDARLTRLEALAGPLPAQHTNPSVQQDHRKKL